MASPNNLQYKILREITRRDWNQRQSYASLGKKLGVDEETVRIRLKHISESGLLNGWQLVINPRLIGRNLASVFVDTNSPKDEMISQLKLVDGVVFIFNFLDNGLRTACYYQDEYDITRKANLISSICGSKSFRLVKHLSPPCDLKLKKTDWEILKMLRKDPTMKLSAMGRELKLSSRTVTRRINFLNENNSFYRMPIGNLKKSSGLLYYALVSFGDSRDKTKTDAVLSETIPQIVFMDSNFQRHSAFSISCQNFSEAEQTLLGVKELVGVESLSFWVLKDIIPTHEWFDHEIEKRLG